VAERRHFRFLFRGEFVSFPPSGFRREKRAKDFQYSKAYQYMGIVSPPFPFWARG